MPIIFFLYHNEEKEKGKSKHEKTEVLSIITTMPVFRGRQQRGRGPKRDAGTLRAVPWAPEQRLACKDLKEQAQGSLIFPGSQTFLEKKQKTN